MRKGSTHTKEAKEKNRQTHIGKTHKKETKKKMSNSHIGKNIKSMKKNWRNPEYRLFEEIKPFPICKWCKSKDTIKNGKNGRKNKKQKYMCNDCRRQFV